MAITRSSNPNTTTAQQTVPTASNAVETVSVPLFTPIMAPKITRTSHEALVTWKKERTEYEKQIRVRCAATGEEVDAVMISLKNTFDEELLATACTYKWKVNKESITDERIMEEIEKIISSVKNDTIPDVQALFKKQLKMDLKESDVAERVLQYFKTCDTIIAENGLKNCFQGKNGSKEKCKLIIASLEPQSLKSEVQREIQYVNEKAKSDTNALFDLIFDKALEQDREFQKRKRSSPSEGKSHHNPNKRHKGSHRRQEEIDSSNAKEQQKQHSGKAPHNTNSNKKPPGKCPKCGEMHWLSDCPSLTEEERQAVRQKMLQKRKEREKKRKSSIRRLFRIRECLDESTNTVIIEDTLCIPYCADTGSD